MQAANVITQRSRKRWAIALSLVAVAAFVVSVVLSAGSASVPVGGSMKGMSMGAAGAVHLSARDVIDGRRVSLPGGKPGAIVFVEAQGCSTCVSVVRAANRAMTRLRSPLDLTVIDVDYTATPDDLRAFARSAGNPRARYMVDDRNGGIATMVGATALGRAVIYDARGQVVGHAYPGTIAKLLNRAAQAG